MNFDLHFILTKGKWWHVAQFSRSVVSDSLWPHGLQHTRLPCLSPTPGVYPNTCPLSWWCPPTISSSVIPFSACPQFFPASGSFPKLVKSLEFPEWSGVFCSNEDTLSGLLDGFRMEVVTRKTTHWLKAWKLSAQTCSLSSQREEKLDAEWKIYPNYMLKLPKNPKSMGFRELLGC